MMATIPECKRCKKNDAIKLRRQFAANGMMQFMWYCTRCNHVADNQKPFVKKSLVQSWLDTGKIPSLDSIQIVNDYRINAVCCVCGDFGAEYHHWLPQCFGSLVDDHSQWPGGYLCKKHHDIWHEIVTPYLPGRGATEYARFTKEKYIYVGKLA